ncbi:hypothetical protein ACW2QC_19890 [Virgibacillus sp. FSP13]
MAGSNILEWGHVQLFSPWEFNINEPAKALLQETDWAEPELNKLPTGRELVEEYLEPYQVIQKSKNISFIMLRFSISPGKIPIK